MSGEAPASLRFPISVHPQSEALECGLFKVRSLDLLSVKAGARPRNLHCSHTTDDTILVTFPSSPSHRGAGGLGEHGCPRQQWAQLGAFSPAVPTGQAVAPERGLMNMAAAGRAAAGGSVIPATSQRLGPFSGTSGVAPTPSGPFQNQCHTWTFLSSGPPLSPPRESLLLPGRRGQFG